jgi:uncharacterized oxidoreductase
MPVCAAAALESGVRQVFAAAGVPQEAARDVAEHLVDAELRGVTSHGVIRVPQYLAAIKRGDVRPTAQLRVIHQTEATISLSGGHGFGQVMARGAMQHAAELACRFGVAVATLTDCGHTGRLGAYTEQAARAGMIAMMMVNAGGNGQWVAPFGGIAGRLATNPLAIAVPLADGEALSLDMATSAAPEGKIRTLAALQRTIPEGWVVDHLGNPSTQPQSLYGPPRGALLPFGGHKGFGLALMVEILAGALSGAGCCVQPDAPLVGTTDGVILIAIQIEAFSPRQSFDKTIERLVSHVKSSPTAPGVAEVLTPGELEARTRRRQLAHGIDLPDSTWIALQESGVECHDLRRA